MSQKIKDILGVAIVISILAVAYSAIVYSNYYSKSIEPSSFRSFSVSAEGKATAVPDIAQFTFSVITQGGKNLSELQAENTEKTNRVIEFIKNNSVDSKDIKTQTYNIEPRYQYFSCPSNAVSSITPRPCPPPEIVGYTITQNVLVKVRDFAKAGDILSGAVSSGANSVSQINFTIDDPTKIENEARADAIQKAKEKAKFVAKEGDFQIGRLLFIDEGGYMPYYYGATKEMSLGMGGDSMTVPTPTIEPGTQEIKVNIILRYEIR